MEKSIKDIGLLKGKVLVFGGVYSNLQALEAIKKLAFADEILLKISFVLEILWLIVRNPKNVLN
jgi:hypothetical protein